MVRMTPCMNDDGTLSYLSNRLSYKCRTYRSIGSPVYRSLLTSRPDPVKLSQVRPRGRAVVEMLPAVVTCVPEGVPPAP